MIDTIHRAVTSGGTTVRIEAHPDVVAEFERLTRPYAVVAEPSGDISLPVVSVYDAPPDEPGWERIARSSEYEPDRVLWADHTGKRVALVGDTTPWLVQQFDRSVRHLLRWQAWARGDLLLHGGMVRVGDAGIAFLGGKRSGKTSSILSAVATGGAEFVSNDDLAITDSVGARLTGYGSTRSMNVRTDSLLAIARFTPVLRDLLAGDHPTNTFDGRHRTIDAVDTTEGMLPGSVWVRPADLAAATGCALVPDGTVDAIVFPRFDAEAGEAVVRRLDPAEARESLEANVETQATKYDPFLAAWFPHADETRRVGLVDRLLAEVPCYQLVQDMAALPAATKRLLAMLTPAGKR